jgi:branched-chain amino acid transport system permease protein
MGADVGRVVVITFALGAALAALAGALVAPIITLTPFIGANALLKAFVVVVLGGFGNIIGTAIAGIGLGVTEGLVSTYISTAYVDTVSFGILIAVLLVRPHGLIGVRVQEA